jgi:hypothetical protein
LGNTGLNGETIQKKSTFVTGKDWYNRRQLRDVWLQRSAKDKRSDDQERVPDAAIRSADRTNQKCRSGISTEKKKQSVCRKKSIKSLKPLWTILVKEENEKPKNIRFTKSDKSDRRIRLQRSFAHQHPTYQGGVSSKTAPRPQQPNQIAKIEDNNTQK